MEYRGGSSFLSQITCHHVSTSLSSISGSMGSNPNVALGRSLATFIAGVEDTARLDE